METKIVLLFLLTAVLFLVIVDADNSITTQEAVIKFDSNTNDLVVFGINENIQVSYTEECAGRTKECLRKTRTYTLTEDVNTLVLKLDYRKSANKISVKILGLKYNDKPEIKPQDNQFAIKIFEKSGNLNQNLYVKKQFNVDASYNKKKDETKILITENRKRNKYAEEGLVFVKMMTDNGILKYGIDEKLSNKINEKPDNKIDEIPSTESEISYLLSVKKSDSETQEKSEITVNENKVTIDYIFEKPTPCTSLNYTILKNGNTIKIIPKVIYGKGICIEVIAYDEAIIEFTLDEGTYTINIYSVWDKSNPLLSKEIIIK